MTAAAAIHIGTSGWHYRHWVGPFYPPGMRPAAWLGHYAQHFAAAEINRSFYRMPSAATLDAWRDAVPPYFRFAVKAHRFITHMKKLNGPIALYDWFFADIGRLEPKLGPILFQLPPRWSANLSRLAAFLSALPRRHRYAFEFRDPSWLTPAVFDLLARYGAALCVYDIAGFRSPVAATADFAYVRLHGPGAKYQGSYADAALGAWADRLCAWAAAGTEAWCFFDNDQNGYAAHDAQRLQALVRQRERAGNAPARAAETAG